MDERYLAIAVPFFIVTMLAEWFVSRAKERKLYRLHDTVASLGCGIGQTLLGFWWNLLVVFVYAVVAERGALWKLPNDAAWVWGASLVGVDFFHYWFHRSSHRVNFLWAGHAVHHQSEEYNLSTALRQSWLEPLFSLPFYLPLAILGVPVEVFLATHTLQTLYQYWIHTRLIGTLGPLDAVFNTPTHHRVHHAINPEYIDKNYAGILIVWDKLFGTFVAEKSEPAYGVVKPLESWNPFRANAAEWVRIAALSFASTSRREAISALWAPPEWLPKRLGGRAEVPPVSASRKLFETTPGSDVDRYVMIQFGAILVLTGVLLRAAPFLGGAILATGSAWLMLGLGTVGGMMHRASWAFFAERVRIALTPTIAGSLFGTTGALAGGVIILLSRLFWPRTGTTERSRK